MSFAVINTSLVCHKQHNARSLNPNHSGLTELEKTQDSD